MNTAKQESKHVLRRQAINSLDKDTIEKLIEQCALRDDDALLLLHKHIHHHDENFIADLLGWSVQTVRLRYSKALNKLYHIAQLRGCFDE